MSLFLVTAPAAEPVSVQDAKAQCRVDTSDEDALFATLVIAAREYVETATHRALITQTWDWTLDGFPDWTLVLPLPPVASVTSITYVDTAGVTQTWAASLYRTDLPAGPYASPARVTPAYSESYPSTRAVTNAVTVRFVAGYGTAASVPASLKAAIKLLVAHWYARREPLTNGTVAPVPWTIEALTWPFKAFG